LPNGILRSYYIIELLNDLMILLILFLRIWTVKRNTIPVACIKYYNSTNSIIYNILTFTFFN